MKWKSGDDPQAQRWEEVDCELEVEMVEPGEDGEIRVVPLKRKGGDDAERYLGVSATSVLWWGEVEHMSELEVKKIAVNCMRANARKFGARMMLRGVAVPKVNHMLKHASASDERLEDIWRPAEIAWKAAVGMAVSTEGGLHEDRAGDDDDAAAGEG
jgi:hypothetical protein